MKKKKQIKQLQKKLAQARHQSMEDFKAQMKAEGWVSMDESPCFVRLNRVTDSLDFGPFTTIWHAFNWMETNSVPGGVARLYPPDQYLDIIHAAHPEEYLPS